MCKADGRSGELPKGNFILKMDWKRLWLLTHIAPLTFIHLYSCIYRSPEGQRHKLPSYLAIERPTIEHKVAGRGSFRLGVDVIKPFLEEI